jgi:thiol-disulfide isomerase/thioredoxin
VTVGGRHDAGPSLGRRALLASAATAGVGLLAGCSTGLGSQGATEEPGGADDGLDSVTIATLDAPGSAAGDLTIPAEGAVTLVDLFATWCGPCVAQLERLAEVRAAVDADVRFVSVTNEALGGELTRSDLVDWWREHGGEWTLAHDAEGELFFQLDATGIPFTGVIDQAGRLTWSHQGVSDPDTVVSELRSVLADG